MDGETLQQMQDGGECGLKISEQIQGITGHHGAKTKGCQRHCFNMGDVAQHAEDTPGWRRHCTQPSKKWPTK